MPQLVMLMAHQTAPQTLKVIEQTRRCLGKHNIKIDVEIDGTDGENAELRKILFDVSGEAGTYPQLFSLEGDTYTCLCKGEEMSGMDEMHECLTEMMKTNQKFLEENPDVQYIPHVFKDFMAGGGAKAAPKPAAKPAPKVEAAPPKRKSTVKEDDLMKAMTSLKSTEKPVEKQKLPTAEDIQEEKKQTLNVEAKNTLELARKSLMHNATTVKNYMPTKDDLCEMMHSTQEANKAAASILAGAKDRLKKSIKADAEEDDDDEGAPMKAHASFKDQTTVHSTAQVDESSKVGEGATVRSGAVVKSGVTLGKSVYIGAGAIINENVTIKDGAEIYRSCTVGAGTTIHEGASVGKGCIIHENADVGAKCQIWAGTEIKARVKLGANVELGWNVIAEEDAVIGADSKLNNNVHVGKGAVVGERAQLGRQVTVEAGAKVHDGAKSGQGETIKA